MQVLDDGGYAISDRMKIPGEGVSDFVFGRGWLVEMIDVTSGDYFFYSDGDEVRPLGRRFGVFYPPFAFVRCFVRNLKGRVVGVGSEEGLRELPSYPFIFETERKDAFRTTREAISLLHASTNRRSILINTQPSPITIGAKQLIDENYLVDPSIARIARRLRISHEHLSRQFKKDYGVSPSRYLHALRVAEATFRLSLGREIVDVSLDAGYNDLSRFYKQFRKNTGTSPSVCRKQVSR